MKIELVQLSGRDGDTAYNLKRAVQAIASCAADTDLLVFPETHLMGFADAEQLADVAETVDGPSVQAIISRFVPSAGPGVMGPDGLASHLFPDGPLSALGHATVGRNG